MNKQTMIKRDAQQQVLHDFTLAAFSRPLLRDGSDNGDAWQLDFAGPGIMAHDIAGAYSLLASITMKAGEAMATAETIAQPISDGEWQRLVAKHSLIAALAIAIEADRRAEAGITTAEARLPELPGEAVGFEPEALRAARQLAGEREWQFKLYNSASASDEAAIVLMAIQVAKMTVKNAVCRVTGKAVADAGDDVEATKQEATKQRIVTEQHGRFKAERVESVAGTEANHEHGMGKSGKAAAAASRIAAHTMGGVVNLYTSLLAELTELQHRCYDRATAAEMLALLGSYSQDAQDFVANAYDGIWQGITMGAAIDGVSTMGYRVLNHWLMAERDNNARCVLTEYITAAGGQLVSINSVIHMIVTASDKWTPMASGEMDEATAARLYTAITAAMAMLNPTQRQIAEALGKGKSIQQIADAMGRAHSTISGHVVAIRQAIAQCFAGGEFEALLREAQIAAVFGKAVARKACKGGKGRTEAGKARKAASDKATQAARAKAYRDRKRAAKLAAQQA